ncbi:MAG: hypothetical protein J5919_04365 [Clostridia bacterium]|nr:hypothetical protein [Clostridia bacterium]
MKRFEELFGKIGAFFSRLFGGGGGSVPKKVKNKEKKSGKGEMIELPFGSPEEIAKKRSGILKSGRGTELPDAQGGVGSRGAVGFDAAFFFRAMLRLGVAVLAGFAVVYFGHHTLKALIPGITTGEVKRITETYSCRGTAYLLRDETAIAMPAGGFADYSVGNGQRVAKGDVLCSIYNSDRSDIRETIDSLDAELELLKKSAGGGVSSAGILETSSGIASDYLSVMESLSAGDLSPAGRYADGLREKFDRQLCLTGRSSGITDRIAAITLARASAVDSLGTPVATIKAGRPGYFFQRCDGYGKIFTASLARELTAESLEAAIASPPEAVGPTAGTLADTAEWYLAVVCAEEGMGSAQTGRDYRVVLTDDDCLEIEMRLEKKIKTEDGLILLFSGKTMPRDCSWLRCQSVSIEYGSVSGYRVPADAVRYHEGMTGVYTVGSGYVVFRRIEVLSEGEGYYIAADYETAEKGAPVITRYIGYGMSGVIDNTRSMTVFASEQGLKPLNGSDGGIDFRRGAGYLFCGGKGYSALTMKRLPSGTLPLRYGEPNNYYYMLNITDEMILTGKNLYHGKVLS